MWRQSAPEILELRRAIRQHIEQLLQGCYGKFQAEGTPQRFVGLLQESTPWNKIVPPTSGSETQIEKAPAAVTGAQGKDRPSGLARAIQPGNSLGIRLFCVDRDKLP